jgi:hypothetical protein
MRIVTNQKKSWQTQNINKRKLAHIGRINYVIFKRKVSSKIKHGDWMNKKMNLVTERRLYMPVDK